MGHKSNPIGLRIGVMRLSSSQYYASRAEYPEKFRNDWTARTIIAKELENCAIARVIIEIANDKMLITILTAKPGLVIGEMGAKKNQVKTLIEKATSMNVEINVSDVRRPMSHAAIVAEMVVFYLQQSVSPRRIINRIFPEAEKDGAQGIKIVIKGRIGGGEIAKSLAFKKGKVPTQTFRADIDYEVREAAVPSGRIGVHVWVFRGMVYNPVEAMSMDRAAVLAKSAANDSRPTSGMRPRRPRHDQGQPPRGSRRSWRSEGPQR